MLTNEEISERNGLLINFITALDMGIHVIDLPHKPKLLSSDYTRQFTAYVKNFHLILVKGTDGRGTNSNEVFLDIRLKPIENMDLEDIKAKMLEWLVIYEHTRIYTIKIAGTELFLSGFNHHNKIEKTNPYPVFARYNPLTYYEIDRVESILERFNNYDLIIN